MGTTLAVRVGVGWRHALLLMVRVVQRTHRRMHGRTGTADELDGAVFTATAVRIGEARYMYPGETTRRPSNGTENDDRTVEVW